MNKRHEPLSVLEVHLDAVARNWLFLKKKLKNGADCAAVVKADAYGLGALRVAPVLFDQGCRHFFVAHADEGVAVRGVVGSSDAAIYVLNGPWGMPAGAFAQHGLIPVLNSIDDVAYWQENNGGACVLHIDTGMNRLGLSAHELFGLNLRGMDIRYAMSHLACADDPSHAMNARQLATFKMLTGQMGIPLRLSLANSAGVLLGQDYHFDLARPGCGLYGINPATGANPMQGAITLRAKILQIREIKEAGTAGYGATYRVAPPAKCATISVGYADGYLRSLTGRGMVAVGSVRCPIIGRVSMDSIIVDVTQAPCRTGDDVEMIGPSIPVDEVAGWAGTIGYEMLTNLGKRYKRIYSGG